MSMKKYFVLFGIALAVLSGCNSVPNHPGEEEVKSILAGRYCAEDFRHSMEIGHDGRYMGSRTIKSAFGSSLVPERCEGNYKLNYNQEKNTWTLKFETSDKNSNPFIKCKEYEILIWEEEKGYMVGDSIVTLTEPLDQEVVSSKCDG